MQRDCPKGLCLEPNVVAGKELQLLHNITQ